MTKEQLKEIEKRNENTGKIIIHSYNPERPSKPTPPPPGGSTEKKDDNNKK